MIKFQPSELPRTLISRSFLLALVYLGLTVLFIYAWLTRPEYSLAWVLAIGSGLAMISMLLMTFIESTAWVVLDEQDDDQRGQLIHAVVPSARRPTSEVDR